MTIERVKGAKIGGEKHEKQKDGQTKHVTEHYFINPTMPMCDIIFLRGRCDSNILSFSFSFCSFHFHLLILQFLGQNHYFRFGDRALELERDDSHIPYFPSSFPFYDSYPYHFSLQLRNITVDLEGKTGD